MPTEPLRPTPPPIDLPMTPLAIGGTLVWIAAAVVLSGFSDQLAAAGNSWWIDCAWWGAALGVPGIITMIVHDRGRKRRRDRAAE